MLSQGLLACWPRTPCSPSQQFMWPTDFVFLFWVMKQRLPPCLHSDPWCNHVHPYAGLGIGFCLLCIFLIHAFHFMYIGNMYPFPHMFLCVICTYFCVLHGWVWVGDGSMFSIWPCHQLLCLSRKCVIIYLFIWQKENSLSGRLQEAQDGGGANRPCAALFSKLPRVVMAVNFP